MNRLQVFSYKGSNITFLDENGMWVNATEMAKKFDRQPYDWLRLQSTKDFISALVEIRGFNTADLGFNTADSTVLNSIGISNFIKIENGKYGGTWFHEDVAIEFARWLSPSFAIWCNDKIKELLAGGLQPLTKAEMRLLVFMDMQSDINRQSNVIARQSKRIQELKYQLESEKIARQEKAQKLLAEANRDKDASVELWLAESKMFSETDKALSLRSLWAAYHAFCVANNLQVHNNKALSRLLRDKGYKLVRRCSGIYYKFG